MEDERLLFLESLTFIPLRSSPLGSATIGAGDQLVHLTRDEILQIVVRLEKGDQAEKLLFSYRVVLVDMGTISCSLHWTGSKW